MRLVTGAGGFTGRRLCAALRGDLVAANRERCDLADAAATRRLLDAVRPAEVYHLAGAFTGAVEDDHRANVVTTENLLGALRDLGLRCRVLLVGSAAEYGRALGCLAETQPLRPVSVYGLSKVCQTLLMRAMAGVPGLEIVMARSFNLYGDGAPPRLLAGRVAAWVAAGKPGRLSLGGLDGVRDYLTVDQAVTAYLRIMAHGVPGEVYNVGSGRPTRVRDLVARLAGGLEQIDEQPDSRGVGGQAGEVIADIGKLQSLPDSWCL